jgi:hypothetical protein
MATYQIQLADGLSTDEFICAAINRADAPFSANDFKRSSSAVVQGLAAKGPGLVIWISPLAVGQVEDEELGRRLIPLARGKRYRMIRPNRNSRKTTNASNLIVWREKLS